MTYFMKSGNTIKLADKANVEVSVDLAPSTYVVKYNNVMKEFYLVEMESFSIPSKLYGDTTKNSARIINTFKDRPNTTGVLMAGEKGSGKSLLAKSVCVNALNLKIPVIVVNEPYCGTEFNKFIQDINTEAVVFIDEFEKMYVREDQEKLLTLLDGSFDSKKLFLLTCNSVGRVDSFMKNRPGRIYYLFDFIGLEPEFIREYCEDVLINKDHTDGVITASAMFEQFNFDMLKAMVEEMNRYNENASDVMKFINARPAQSESHKFAVTSLTVNGVGVKGKSDEHVWVNPLTTVFDVDVDTDPEDDEAEIIGYSFQPSNIIKINKDTGSYVYRKETDEGVVVLEIKPESTNKMFDYTRLLV